MAEKQTVRLRAMQTIRRTEHDISKKMTGVHRHWIVPGAGTAVFETTPERAEHLLEQGFAVALGPDIRKTAKKPKDEPKGEPPLPRDFPYRTQLVAAGLTTLEAVATFPDLTQIDGIGDAYAERIKKRILELEEGEEG